jgi:hypothetical protein
MRHFLRQEGAKEKEEHKSIAVNVTLETQFYEYDRRPYKQMNITGNETASRKVIRLKLEQIQSRKIILKQKDITDEMPAGPYEYQKS